MRLPVEVRTRVRSAVIETRRDLSHRDSAWPDPGPGASPFSPAVPPQPATTSAIWDNSAANAVVRAGAGRAARAAVVDAFTTLVPREWSTLVDHEVDRVVRGSVAVVTELDGVPRGV